MNAVLVLEPGGVRLMLSPDVAGRVVLDWLQGREPAVQLSRGQLERLAAAVESTGQGCGGAVRGGEVNR